MYFASRIAPAARANLRMSDRLRALHGVFFAGDADRSGHLSPAEFLAGIAPLVGPLDSTEQEFLFDAFDFSRDGRIDLAEFDYALFRDVQAAGDAADVRGALAALLLRKLAAFRALAPGERGNRGSKVDINVVDLQQRRVKAEQRRGQGLAAAAARVLSSKTGLVSLAGLAALVVGLVLNLLMRDRVGLLYVYVAIAGYVVYAAASFSGHDFGLVSNAVSGAEGLAAQFDPVYRANAAYRWHISCYHYETRTTRDSKGHTHSERVRVTTHTATLEGRLRSFEVSAPFVPDENSYALTEVISRARVQVRFEEYFHARDRWRAANTRDTHQDFSSSETIPGLRPEVLVEFVPGLKPWWMARWAFAAATLLLSSVCFRVAFHARCGRQDYLFVKDAVAFTEDAECEEARMYDAEKQGLAAAGAVFAPAAPPQLVVVAAAAPPQLVGAAAAPAAGVYVPPSSLEN